MNLILGIAAGGLVGWIAYGMLNATREKGLRASLFIGLVGGALGVQLSPLFSASHGSEGQFDLFSLVISAASAAGCLIVANIIAQRSRA